MKKITHLPSGVVIQRSDLIKHSSDELTAFMNQVSTFGKKIYIVDSLASFFSMNNLLECIDKANIEYVNLIAEKRGIDISADEIAQVVRFNSFKEQLQTRIKSLGQKYTFEDVPPGWSIEKHITISKTSVYRKNSSSYKIGLKTLEGLWKKASKFWLDEDKENLRIYSIQASGYNRDATVYSNRIEVGCQTIHRYELEQVAVHLNWEMPS